MAEIGSFATQMMGGAKGLAEKAPLEPKGSGAVSGASFVDTLKGAIGTVNEAQTSADAAARKFAAGEGGNLHDVMISMEKAEVSLRTLTSVRNKMLEAYQEVMRLQV